MADVAILSAPEGTPEGLRIPHRSGTWGIQQIRANNIRIRRIRLGWSQLRLAQEAGSPLTNERIFRLEIGSGTPSKDEVELIANALGCTPRELEQKE